MGVAPGLMALADSHWPPRSTGPCEREQGHERERVVVLRPASTVFAAAPAAHGAAAAAARAAGAVGAAGATNLNPNAPPPPSAPIIRPPRVKTWVRKAVVYGKRTGDRSSCAYHVLIM